MEHLFNQRGQVNRKEINMSKGIYVEDSDVFFNMRGSFWQESRDRELAEKGREGAGLGQDKEREKIRFLHHVSPVRIATGS
jgi:hypothetical protein